MRVIAGTARGIKLEAPAGDDVRPTIDRVKEAIFSSIQFEVPGAKVLDAFAGSGQLGIEALSRGATKAVFLDTNREAAQLVQRNLKAAGLFTQATVAMQDAASFTQRAADKFDIILLDPPYGRDSWEELLPQLAKICNPNAVIICER